MSSLSHVHTPATSTVRQATPDDIPRIHQLLEHYAGMGDLLPRSIEDLNENIQHFSVIEESNQILACGSLEHFTKELAEVRSLMVSESSKGRGLGKIIVSHLILPRLQMG